MSNFQKLVSGIPTGTQVQGTDIGSGAATSTQVLAANGSGSAAFRSLAAGDLPTITLTSDVTGSGTGGSVATTVAKIQGTTVSGTTGNTNVVFSNTPAIQTAAITGVTTISDQVLFRNTSDTSRHLALNLVNMSSNTTLTLASTQSTNQTLAFPNITSSDTLATLGLAQTFSGATVFSASGTALTVNNNSQFSGLVDITGNTLALGVGTTSGIFTADEQVSSLYTLTSPISVDAAGIASNINISGNTASGNSANGGRFNSTRTTTASVTTDTINAQGLLVSATLANGANAYTTSGLYTGLTVGPLTVGSTTPAMSYAGIRISNDTATITGRKSGIYLLGISGATNNAFITDNQAYTGNFFINQSGTNASSFGGAITAGATGTALTVTNNATISGTLTTGNIKNASNVLNIEDSTDATKIIALNSSGNTTAKTLTLASSSTTSQTLTIPNITGADTLATLGLAQTFSAAITLSASGTALTISNNAQISGVLGIGVAPSTTSALTIGNTNLTGPFQRGGYSNFTSSSAATSGFAGFESNITQANSITSSNVISFYAAGITVGSGSTITRVMDFLSLGTNGHPATNNASLADNTSFTGNFFINQSGTDPSTFSNGVFTIKASGNLAVSNGTTTAAHIDFLNTGNPGGISIGSESSTGGSLFSGSTAYACVLGTSDSNPTQIFTHNKLSVTLDTSQNMITSAGFATKNYDTASPATTNTVTASANTPGLLMTPAGTIAAATVKLPSSPFDGQQYWVASSQIITTVTWQDSGGTAGNVIGGQTTIGGTNRGQRFVYSSANTKWYSIG